MGDAADPLSRFCGAQAGRIRMVAVVVTKVSRVRADRAKRHDDLSYDYGSEMDRQRRYLSLPNGTAIQRGRPACQRAAVPVTLRPR